MNSASHCQLLVPGMVPELAAASPTPPALRTLLRHARRADGFTGEADAWLCRFFAVDRQQDWPVAPFCALADGLDSASGYWLCASPVHLQVRRDSLVVAGMAPDALEQMQARTLVEALNDHFAEDGLELHAPQPSRWYLRMANIPSLQTTPLSSALGRSVNDLLPQGADAMLWHRRINELQMLLHEHPVNLALEQNGAWPINSLWLWGGGVLPQPQASQAISVWAQSPVARGLTLAHGMDLSGPPASVGDWLADGRAGSSRLAVLDGLRQAEQERDGRMWANALETLDQRFFAPVLQGLRQGRISRVSLHFAGGNKVVSHVVERADLWKFWHSPRSLEACLG